MPLAALRLWAISRTPQDRAAPSAAEGGHKLPHGRQVVGVARVGVEGGVDDHQGGPDDVCGCPQVRPAAHGFGPGVVQAVVGGLGFPVRGLEPGYAYGRPGGRIPQSLPRGRFGGGLRQLHLSAAWTSHNTPAFDFAAAHSN